MQTFYLHLALGPPHLGLGHTAGSRAACLSVVLAVRKNSSANIEATEDRCTGDMVYGLTD